jgi:capsular exopolysaccharide synthesis family protein
MLTLLRQNMWLLILCVFGAAMAGTAYIVASPKMYRAEAVIQVKPATQKVFQEANTQVEDINVEEQKRKTVEQTLTSPELLVGLIVHNNLDTDPEFLPGLKRPASDSKMAEELTRHISAQVRRGTLLIDIKVDDRNPRMAQNIANLLIEEVIRQNLQQRLEASETMHTFLLAQADRLQTKLTKSEETLQAYKEQHPDGALGTDAKDNIVVEKLDALNRMVTEAKATRLKLEADYEQLKKLGTGAVTALLAIPSIANSPVVIEAQKNIAQHEGEVAALHQIYKPGQGSTPSAVRQLDELKAGLNRAILKAADELTSAYNSAVVTEGKMQKALQEQKDATLAFNKASIAYNLLRQGVESDRALYNSVLTRLKEIDVLKEENSQDAIRIISHPLLPERPIAPNKKQALILSLLGGLALGFSLSSLSAVLRTSLRTTEEVEGQLGLPALGVIPVYGWRPKSLTDDLLLIEQPGSPTAESFRSLRASLSVPGRNVGQKTYLFTSAVAREGKSYCAINCAVAFAQMGLKTLLIDADLRKPSIDKVFFGGEPVDGLSEALIGRRELHEAVLMTDTDNLFVLCAGTHLDTPAELLASEAFSALVSQVREKFDRVVIDSAPTQLVSDSLSVAAHADAVCLVVSCGTSAHVASQAIRKLDNAGSSLAGIILNRASVRPERDYCSYRYSHGIWTHKKSRKRERNSKPQVHLRQVELTEL